MNSLREYAQPQNLKSPTGFRLLPRFLAMLQLLAELNWLIILKSGELLAECQVEALNYYKFDAVFALMDTSVETEAVGSVLAYPQYHYPHVAQYAADTVGIENFKNTGPA